MNRKITYENIKYGMLVEYLHDYGGYHAGVKVHFFNKKGVLIGNYYEFVPYEKLRLRLPYGKDPRNPKPYDGKDRTYQKFFMGQKFERLKRAAFMPLLYLTSSLLRFTQKHMD
jgi:hypothetical protein